ncbi:MAG: hypothetical protein IJ677_09140 [Alphaproteobacteria bacterium]|nr:hypothetical protein [Alphaproteobacteria bacterium]
MVKTYIENEVIPQIPDEYSEENLRKKFVERQNEIWKEIEDNLEYYNRLKKTEKEAEITGMEFAYMSNDELKKELKFIRAQTENYRVETDGIREEAKLLQKYGSAFAKLYYIKDQHEKKGYDEKLSFTEIDITGNGDIITDAQHYGMSFDPEGKLTQPALVVKVDDDLQFNVGMMEFNKPNSAPEIKLQISFDENTAQNLDSNKINAIFDFCEKYGISSSDMIVRRFDGSIDDGAIQEKISRLMSEVEAKRAEQMEKAARDEYNEQQAREKELIKDIEKQAQELGVELPKGLTLEQAIKFANEKFPAGKKINTDNISTDYPLNDGIVKPELRTDSNQKFSFKDNSVSQVNGVLSDDISSTSAQTTSQQVASQTASATMPVQSAPLVKAPKKFKKEDVEKQFEKFFEEGMAKRRDLSYFKTHTGLFGKGWTEYIIYDTEDKNNRKNDGREDKNGNVKYTYSFKLFIRQNKDGSMDFAYRTPYHKPVSEDVVDGIVSHLKDLGFTHINFPNGMPDKEKSIWRKMMAEKGLVPVGMSLNRSKAEGMIKAAKEKLSSEEFSNFKYKLALQMDKRNKEKGKKVDKSEQDFIDGLLLARKYEAFSNGYSEVLKGMITRLVHPENERPDGNGAIDKIAAMANLRRMFNVFKAGVETGNILNSHVLTDKEKDIIMRDRPDLLENPSKFTGGQLAQLYNIMLHESKNTTHAELEKKFREPGAKRADEAIKQGEFNAAYNSCKSIIKELKALGVDEIDLPETTTNLPYNAPIRNKPTPAPTNTQGKPAQNVSAGIAAAAHSYDRGDR